MGDGPICTGATAPCECRTVSPSLISAFAAHRVGQRSMIASWAFGLVYLMLARVLSWLTLLARSDVAKDFPDSGRAEFGRSQVRFGMDLPCVDCVVPGDRRARSLTRYRRGRCRPRGAR